MTSPCSILAVHWESLPVKGSNQELSLSESVAGVLNPEAWRSATEDALQEAMGWTPNLGTLTGGSGRPEMLLQPMPRGCRC